MSQQNVVLTFTWQFRRLLRFREREIPMSTTLTSSSETCIGGDSCNSTFYIDSIFSLILYIV